MINQFAGEMRETWRFDMCVSLTIAAGDFHNVGLNGDGTLIVTVWNEYIQYDVTDWKEIVAVATGGNLTVGLKLGSTFVAAGDNSDKQCDTSSWGFIAQRGYQLHSGIGNTDAVAAS